MTRPGLSWASFLLSFMTIASAMGGSLSGTVADEHSQGVAGIEILLIDEHGFANMAITDAQGNYAFYQPSPGIYELRLNEQLGYTVTHPACGFFTIEIQPGKSNLANFEIIISGVSVDFVRPAGGGTIFPPLDPHEWDDNPRIKTFAFAMKIDNLHSVNLFPPSV